MSLPESTPALLFGLQNRPDILEEVLISSIHGEKFLDVEFRAPSRRLATGGVGGFKPILANSTILKAVSPYFAELLADREMKMPAAAQSSVQGDSAETIFDYDDECDSDLEDEPASDGSAGAASAVSSQPSKYDASSKARAGSVSEGESESDWQSMNETVFSRPTMSDSGRRIIYMKDIAASTMEALILYLYTGKVYFLPPTSSGIQAQEDATKAHTLGNTRNRPMCSAKSMYCIADKMGMADLKTKARENLLSNMNEKNILEEYFSFFASKHSEIREMLLRQLRKHHWSCSIPSRIDAMVDRVVQGNVKHSGPALRLLLREIPAPRPITPPSSTLQMKKKSVKRAASSLTECHARVRDEPSIPDTPADGPACIEELQPTGSHVPTVSAVATDVTISKHPAGLLSQPRSGWGFGAEKKNKMSSDSKGEKEAPRASKWAVLSKQSEEDAVKGMTEK